jgi:hypothetical protein
MLRMRSPHRVVSVTGFWLSVVLGTLTLAPRTVVAEWPIGDPIVTYWAGPGYDGMVPFTDTVARQMVELGINVVWAATAAEVDLAGRHGLRALYQNRTILLPKNLDDPAMRLQIDATVKELRNKPGFYGYHIIDEPPATRFKGLGRLVDYLRQRDPDHLLRINLFPSNAEPAAIGAPDYSTYLNDFCRIVRPSLLSYDFYQLHTTYDYPTYLENLAIVANKAQAIGVPFMTFVQASKWAQDIRVPNSNEMRYLVYTTLAHGAQGIGYYVWWWPKHEGGIVDSNGNPTAIHDTLKVLNREFVAIAKQYRKWKLVGVCLKGYRPDKVPPGTTALPGHSLFDIQSIPNDQTFHYGVNYGQPLRGVLFGCFGKDGSRPKDVTAAMVVNLDYSVDKTYTINGPGKLSVFNATTGRWKAAGQDSVTVDLPPGGGVLVGLTSAVAY